MFSKDIQWVSKKAVFKQPRYDIFVSLKMLTELSTFENQSNLLLDGIRK